MTLPTHGPTLGTTHGPTLGRTHGPAHSYAHPADPVAIDLADASGPPPPQGPPALSPEARTLPSADVAHTPRSAPVLLDGETLDLDRLVRVAVDRAPVDFAEPALERVRAGRAIVEAAVQSGDRHYGITTGVGSQKESRLDAAGLAAFNRRLLAAHATRVPGPVITPEVLRAALTVQLNLFATGTSGVRVELMRLLAARLNADRMPAVDASGSVGASDLVPLAQLALGLLADAPERAFEPGAKEALSLMNSNAISLGQGALHLAEARRLLATFDLAGAMALEGIRANLSSIAEPVTAVHRRRGQRRVAGHLRALLAGSRLWQPGQARFLQDPLSYRCVSQIHGVAHEVLDMSIRAWTVELNAPTDNPLIDLTAGRIVSHGNMDSTALTAAVDPLRQILAKVVDLSGERLHKQHWPQFSGLPTGLAHEEGAMGGVQFLNLSHIAASLIASCRIWAQPVLLNAVGQLADGVEDTAGLAMHAVADFSRLIDAAYKVATIEILVGCWAVLRRGLGAADLGVGLRPVFEAVVPELPIGREGETPWSISALVDQISRGDLVERAYAEAGVPMIAAP